MIPPDDLARALTLSQPGGRPSYSVVGDTYTVLVPGEATAGRYALIEMHVPPGGGPDPHRHACEELFLVMEGEIEVFFRGQRMTAGAGAAVNVPANAPHMFKNRSGSDARVLSVVAPAGLDGFFAAGGVRVNSTAAPPLPRAEADAQKRRMAGLAGEYGVEFLPPDTFRNQEG